MMDRGNGEFISISGIREYTPYVMSCMKIQVFKMPVNWLFSNNLYNKTWLKLDSSYLPTEKIKFCDLHIVSVKTFETQTPTRP